jgi:hypothetical protein
LIKGSSKKPSPVSSRLAAISFGSPIFFTKVPIAPPWINELINAQKTNSDRIVVAARASSRAMPRLKLSLISSGIVISKQLKQKVARKKIPMSSAIFGCARLCAH